MDKRDILDNVPWHKLSEPASVRTAYTPPTLPALPASSDPRWAMFAAVTLALFAGILVFAVVNGRPPKPAAMTQSIAPVIQERIIERVVTATPDPTAQPTAPPPPVYVAPVRPQAQPVRPAQNAPRQPVRNLPAPTVQVQAAWPAPATGTAKGSMGYQCADGRYFPADDGRWGIFGFGQWIASGQGDVIDIRDTNDAGDRNMGWHYKCQRVWR